MTTGLGKYGITGNTGIGVLGMAHVSASYDATKGKVFVDDDFGGWRRVTRAEAKKAGKTPIECSEPGCGRAAVSLDHLYPYHADFNRCARHYGRRSACT